LISGCFILFAFSICALFLKESSPSKTGKQPQSENPTVESHEENLPTNDARPVSMSTLLTTYSVMIPIINYGMLGLMDIGIYVLLPLFYSSPVGIGGLGFSPPVIGTLFATFGLVDSCVQGLFAPTMIKRFGAKKLFCWAVLWFYPLTLLFPLMSAVVTTQGRVGPITWVLLFVQLLCIVFIDLAYTVVFILVTRAAPNRLSLGSVNGLNQSLSSIARAIGPVLTTSLFAASKQYNILGGNFVYVIMAMLATILVALSRRLPELEEEEE